MKTQPAIAIQQALMVAFPNASAPMLDQSYLLLEPAAWSIMHRMFAHSMFQEGLPDWVREKGDCDDWAWLFRAYIIKRNWHQSQAPLPIAIFYLHYTTREGIRHAVNCAVIRIDDRLEVLPIEPQPNHGGPFEMTAEERNSCTLIIG